MNKLGYVLALAFLAVFSGCDKDDAPERPAPGYDYYPLAIGRYWEYDVEELRYIDKYKTDSPTEEKRYQLREEIDTTGTDLTGQTYFRILRSSRPDSTAEWKQDSIYTVKRLPSRLERYEQNKRVIKLAFPVLEGKKWSADTLSHTLDTLFSEQVQFRYRDVGKPMTVGGKSFETTLRVMQAAEVNAVEEIDSHEIYAKGVGMAFKRYKRYQSAGAGLNLNEDFIQQGVDRTYTLTRYGQ